MKKAGGHPAFFKMGTVPFFRSYASKKPIFTPAS